jgi:hypothetical protein
MPVDRRATRVCAIRPIGRRWKRSSPSCSPPGDDAHGRRLRGLIVILWRAATDDTEVNIRVGLRIQEALALAEADLDQRRGALVVRRGKGGRRREVGMTAGAGTSCSPGSSCGVQLPVGRCSASTTVQHAVDGSRAPPHERTAENRRPRGGPAAVRAAPAPGTPMQSSSSAKASADRHPTPTRPQQPRHHIGSTCGASTTPRSSRPPMPAASRDPSHYMPHAETAWRNAARRAMRHCRHPAYGGNPAAWRAPSGSAKDWTRTTRPSRTVKSEDRVSSTSSSCVRPTMCTTTAT